MILEVEGIRKPDVEILGTRNAGMKSIWKRNSGWQEAQHADGIIDDLGEISLLLKNLTHI